jgi:hypothetical protein
MRQRPWRRRRTADGYNPAMTILTNAALPPSAALVPAAVDDNLDLPTGLTEDDVTRISAAIAAARTESTRHVYTLVWNQWERWCDARGIPAVPGDPLALCAYLTERAEAGRATGTLDMACTVIRHVHRTCEIPDPVASEAVRQVRRGLRRTYGAAPRRLARPLSVAEIRQIIGAIDRSTPIGIRDAAIIQNDHMIRNPAGMATIRESGTKVFTLTNSRLGAEGGGLVFGRWLMSIQRRAFRDQDPASGGCTRTTRTIGSGNEASSHQ